MRPSTTPIAMILLLLPACNGPKVPIRVTGGGDSTTTGAGMLTSSTGGEAWTGQGAESSGSQGSGAGSSGGTSSGGESSSSTGVEACEVNSDGECMCGAIRVHPSICGCVDRGERLVGSTGGDSSDSGSGSGTGGPTCECPGGVFWGSCTGECESLPKNPCVCPWGLGTPTIDCDCYISEFEECICADGMAVYPHDSCGLGV